MFFMKKTLVIFFILLLTTPLIITHDNNTIKSNDLFNFIKSQHFRVKQWKIYEEEKLGTAKNYKQFRDMINSLGIKADSSNWKYEREEFHHFQAAGFYHDGSSGLYIERKILGIYNSGQYEITMGQTVTGDSESEFKRVRIENVSKKNQEQFFYTIISSRKEHYTNKAMEILANNILKHFSAKKSEALVENDLISISANSKLINSSIPLRNKKKMNLQVAVRTLGGRQR
ncbi:hypothetical protein EWI07_09605 [Sporolactobacillus sp. THM7-4]|nr:hypothetical protein EWI07_09605 [Sporolactobacillus sp. THM7-4]